MARDIFGPHSWRDDAGTWWGEARYAAQHPVVPRKTAQQLSSPSVNTPKVEMPYPDLLASFFGERIVAPNSTFFFNKSLCPPGCGLLVRGGAFLPVDFGLAEDSGMLADQM